MARPKSDDKRTALLAAATAVFAERGVWATPTSAISKAAGVAEGTLFTYFSTKDILLNELYRAIKTELAEIVLADFPETADLRGKFYHVWQRYVHWGATHPDKAKVLAQLSVSDQIKAESRVAGEVIEIERLAAESIRRGEIMDYPLPFISALVGAMAETTMAIMAESDDDIDYCSIGFEILWRGIVKP